MTNFWSWSKRYIYPLLIQLPVLRLSLFFSLYLPISQCLPFSHHLSLSLSFSLSLFRNTFYTYNIEALTYIRSLCICSPYPTHSSPLHSSLHTLKFISHLLIKQKFPSYLPYFPHFGQICRALNPSRQCSATAAPHGTRSGQRIPIGGG